MKSEVLFGLSCLSLCDPMTRSLSGPPVHGILQAEIQEWVAISSSRELPDPGVKPGSPALQADLPSESLSLTSQATKYKFCVILLDILKT